MFNCKATVINSDKTHHCGCVPLRLSGSGSVIRDHSDRGRLNEPMNPFWTRIHWLIWSTMIQMISDRWSWSGSSQRNAPMESSISSLQWSRRSTLGSICDVSFKYSRETSNWFQQTITRKLHKTNKTICSSQILYHEPNRNQERCWERWMLYAAFKRRKTGRYWNASYFERLNFISTWQSLMTTSYYSLWACWVA